MEGDKCGKDRTGLHTNTHDTDCKHCKSDLFLSAVISPECPDQAVCPAHAEMLGASAKSCILLYK